jgi:hypothetical protein
MRLFTFLVVTAPIFAADELTVYDLLPPETHKFAIVYDVSATAPSPKKNAWSTAQPARN